MDQLEGLKAFLENNIPYNGFIGVKIEKLGRDEVVVTLEFRDQISNHISTIHAGALYSVAELATGAIAGANFDIMTFTPLLKGAEFKYFKTVRSARGVATASADDIAAAQASLTEKAKGEVPVDVVILNEKNEEACKGRFIWAFRKLG